MISGNSIFRIARQAFNMNERLILYTRNQCGYCDMVRDVASELSINLEERNVWENDQWRDELIAERGIDVVPILRHETISGEIQWLPESDAIVRYLLQDHNQD